MSRIPRVAAVLGLAFAVPALAGAVAGPSVTGAPTRASGAPDAPGGTVSRIAADPGTPPDKLLFTIGGNPYPAGLGDLDGVAMAADGTFYVVDTTYDRIVHLDADGRALDAWGARGTRQGQFLFDTRAMSDTVDVGIAVAPDGSVYVADEGNARVQRFAGDGTFIGAWDGRSGASPPLVRPGDVAVARDGTVYVQDVDTGRLTHYASDGAFLGAWRTGGVLPPPVCAQGASRALCIATAPDGSVYAGTYTESGPTIAACITRYDVSGRVAAAWPVGEPEIGRAVPLDLAVASGGDVIVSIGAGRLVRFAPDGSRRGADTICRSGCRGLAADEADGVWTAGYRSITHYGADGAMDVEIAPSPPPAMGTFSDPSSVAVDRWGYVYVADAGLHRVLRFDRSGRFAGQWGGRGAGRGEFNAPLGVATSPDTDVVYVADTGNDRIQVFSPAGRFAGELGASGSGDGQLDRPSGVAANDASEVFVADTGNDRVCAFTARGTFLRCFGGPGSGAGALDDPRDVAVDPSSGGVIVSDAGHHRLALFSSEGNFVRAVGGFGGGDGQFQGVAGIGVSPQSWLRLPDESPRIYAVDRVGHLVQRFAASDVPLMAWGGYGAGRDTLFEPADVAVSALGTVYVVDAGNDRVKVLGSDGAFVETWGRQAFLYRPSADAEAGGEGEIVQATDVAAAPDGSILVLARDGVLRFGAEGLYAGRMGRRGSPEDGPVWSADAGALAVAPDGGVHVLAGYYGDEVVSFAADGTFATRWSTYPPGIEPGSANTSIRDIAAGSDGSIYVAGDARMPVQRFTATGELLGSWLPQVPGAIEHLAAGPSGDVYATGPGYSPARFGVERFAATGESIGRFGRPGTGAGEFGGACTTPWAPCGVFGLAVDAGGVVYAGDPQLGRVQRFDRRGDPLDAVVPPRDAERRSFPSARFDVDRRAGEQRLVAITAEADGVRVYGSERPSDWRMEVYGNADLAERAMAVAYVPDVSFDWGEHAPTPALIGDGFSIRLRRVASMPSGLYAVRVRADGGVRVWADDEIVLDRWHDDRVYTIVPAHLGATGAHTEARRPDFGLHDLLIEHRDGPGDHRLIVEWDLVTDGHMPMLVPFAAR